MYVYVLLLTSMTRVTGLVTITADTTEYVIDGNVGRNVTLKCHIDNLHKPITWMHSRVARPLSNCDDNNDNCNPGSVLNYIFSSNFTNMNYFLLIQNINWTNEGNFTCEQGDGSYATTSFAIKAVLPLYPPSISETSGEGTYMLETTTECIYPIAEISVRWYVRNANNTTKEYSRISATRSENKTACDIYNTGQVTSSITIKKSTSHTNTVKFFVIISLDGKDWKSLDTQDDYDIEDNRPTVLPTSITRSTVLPQPETSDQWSKWFKIGLAIIILVVCIALIALVYKFRAPIISKCFACFNRGNKREEQQFKSKYQEDSANKEENNEGLDTSSNTNVELDKQSTIDSPENDESPFKQTNYQE